MTSRARVGLLSLALATQSLAQCATNFECGVCGGGREFNGDKSMDGRSCRETIQHYLSDYLNKPSFTQEDCDTVIDDDDGMRLRDAVLHTAASCCHGGDMPSEGLCGAYFPNGNVCSDPSKLVPEATIPGQNDSCLDMNAWLSRYDAFNSAVLCSEPNFTHFHNGFEFMASCCSDGVTRTDLICPTPLLDMVCSPSQIFDPNRPFGEDISQASSCGMYMSYAMGGLLQHNSLPQDECSKPVEFYANIPMWQFLYTAQRFCCADEAAGPPQHSMPVYSLCAGEGDANQLCNDPQDFLSSQVMSRKCTGLEHISFVDCMYNGTSAWDYTKSRCDLDVLQGIDELEKLVACTQMQGTVTPVTCGDNLLLYASMGLFNKRYMCSDAALQGVREWYAGACCGTNGPKHVDCSAASDGCFTPDAALMLKIKEAEASGHKVIKCSD